MELSGFIVLIGLKWSLEYGICTYSSNVFQTKMRKRKTEKEAAEVEGGKKTEEGDRGRKTAHTAKMLRHRRGTVVVADAVRERSRISRKLGGDFISQLKGKHCSHRLQHCNVPALEEIKWKKGNIDLDEQELQSWQQLQVNAVNASTAAPWVQQHGLFTVCSWVPIRQSQPTHWAWLQRNHVRGDLATARVKQHGQHPTCAEQNHQKPPQSHTRWVESQGSPWKGLVPTLQKHPPADKEQF